MKAKTIFLILLCLVITGGAAYIFRDFIFSSGSTPLYVGRENGISDHEISDDILESVESTLVADDMITSGSVYLDNKVIKIVLEADTIEIAVLEEFLDGVLLLFDEDTLDFYDLEILVDNPNAEDLFPLIGYKGNGSDFISYSN